MKKTRIIVCAFLVLLMLIPLGAANVSAADTVSIWDGTRDSSWYDSTATELVINDAADLADFAYQVRSGKQFVGVTVKLNCNIIWAEGDASEWSATNKPARVWSTIGTSETNSFRGTFDGQGHYVSGLYCKTTGSSRAGFFGEICNATVKNLSVINSYFCADQLVGGIAGMARFTNTISDCYVDAYIHSITAAGQVGGLIGQAFNGYADNSLTISNCETRGVITSDLSQQVGGMVGIAKGTSKDKNKNEVLTSLTLNMTNCLSTATLSGASQIGGMVGKAEYSNATFNTCYYKGDLYAWSTANIGGVVGGFGGDVDNNGFTLTVNACYYDGNFYRGSGASLAGLYVAPTRVGGVFGTTDTYGDTTYQSTLYGSVASSSTYYTDSANDNSGERSGSMSVFGTHTSATTTNYTYLKPTAKSSSGGLSAWLKKATSYTTDKYGNVRLTTFSLSHDCADHYGEWIANGEGVIHVCTYGSCVATETRDLSFDVVEASVRYDDPVGIRFLTKVNKNTFFKNLYTGNDDSYAYSGANITFGTVILPTDMLDGDLTVDTEGAVNITARNIYNVDEYAQTSDTFYYSAVLVNLPDQIDVYNRDLAVRSYAKYDVNGESVCVYTDTVVTSFYNVAENIYESSDTTQSVKEGLNLKIALGAISDKFYSENPDKVQILEYASAELFDEYAESLESEGFTKHTNYTASGNSFGLYYNDDYVVTFYYTPETIGSYVEPNQEWYAYGTQTTEDMAKIENDFGVTVDKTVTNIMRVMVEKRSHVDLPGTASENVYTRNNSITNSIGEIFPNDNYSHYGMGYIVQLADGSFIVIDGGENEDDPRNDSTDTDSDLLYQYMMAKKPDNHDKPVIAAWILTHRHNDHVEVFQGFASEYSELVDIEQVIYNFASGVIAAPTEERKTQRFVDAYISDYYPDAKIVNAHTGYKFYIRNAEITILYSIDDLAPFDITKVFTNNESIVFDMVIDGEQRIMFTGEVFIPGSYALIRHYGADLVSDVIQFSHHGHYGAIEELYQYIWPASQDYSADDKFVLWPIGNENQRSNRLSLAENQWIVNRLVEDGVTDYMSKIHSACDLIFESGKVSDTSGIQSDTDVINSGAIGSWHFFNLYTKAPDYDTMKPWPWSN